MKEIDFDELAQKEGITVELARQATALAEGYANSDAGKAGAEFAEDEPLVISSLVVETNPDKTESLIAAINATSGAEVVEAHGYKLVVYVEASSVEASADIASSFIQLDGVLGINLVYCNFEEDPSIVAPQ